MLETFYMKISAILGNRPHTYWCMTSHHNNLLVTGREGLLDVMSESSRLSFFPDVFPWSGSPKSRLYPHDNCNVIVHGSNIGVKHKREQPLSEKCLADFRGLSNESGSVVNNEQDVAARLNNGKLPMGSSHPRATVCGHSLGSLKS